MLINRTNYEEFFLLYVDGELSAGDRIAVEKFAREHPDLLEELNILKETVLLPENEIVFAEKEKLYKEEKRRVVSIVWWRVAAAAVLLFGFGTWGWLYLNNNNKPTMENNAAPVATIKTIDPVKAESPANTIAAEPIKERELIQLPANDIVEIKKRKTDIPKQPKPDITAIEPVMETPVAVIMPATIKPASVNEPKENIITAIQPQEPDNELNKENDIIAAHQVSAPEYGPSTNEDMIYLANTTVSKRNKFRGVFRKATRFIDKVTSVQ